MPDPVAQTPSLPPDPMVTAEWLARHLEHPGVRVIDASWFLPDEQRSAHKEYTLAHIPGAVFFDIDQIADHDTDLPHMLPPPAAFAGCASHLGLSRGKTVVAYDTHGVRSAARAWWMLRTMGFPDVRVLDGGFPTWCGERRPIEVVVPRPRRSCVQPDSRPDLVASMDEVTAYLIDPAAQILDARSEARFRGDVAEPRGGLRRGHMPSALNLPWNEVVADTGQLKSAAALRGVFAQAGVRLDQPIVTTCGSGVTAAILALALARLGRFDVPVYDGSWAEWGAAPEASVVTGA